jgi:hypothetical protein
LAVTVVLAAGAAMLPATAHANVADVWTTYAGMQTCKSDLLNLNGYCFGLQDGRAIGLISPTVAVDTLDQALGIRYDDENVLPSPEGPDNPVVEVWNNTSIATFLAPGTSAAADTAAGLTVYYIPPGADLTGPPVDADSFDATYYRPSDGSLGVLSYIIDTGILLAHDEFEGRAVFF